MKKVGLKLQGNIECITGKKKVNLFKRIFRARWCYLGILPTVALLAVFRLYPAIDGILKSFFNWKKKNYFNPTFNGFDNYITLFQDAEFWRSFLNLGIVILAGFITTFVINLVATYLVYKLGNKRSGRFFQKAFVIPMMIPAMVGTMFWKFFYEYNDGLLNTILRGIGLENLATVWLGNTHTALASIIFTGFPWVGGFAFLILLAGFQGIDRSLGESADLDGANAFVKFWKIDLPLVIPQMKILSIMGMISGIQAYDMHMVLTQGQYGTMVPGLYMYQTAFTHGNYGYASAMGVFLFLIILIITILQNKFIVKAD